MTPSWGVVACGQCHTLPTERAGAYSGDGGGQGRQSTNSWAPERRPLSGPEADLRPRSARAERAEPFGPLGSRTVAGPRPQSRRKAKSPRSVSAIGPPRPRKAVGLFVAPVVRHRKVPRPNNRPQSTPCRALRARRNQRAGMGSPESSGRNHIARTPQARRSASRIAFAVRAGFHCRGARSVPVVLHAGRHNSERAGRRTQGARLQWAWVPK